MTNNTPRVVCPFTDNQSIFAWTDTSESTPQPSPSSPTTTASTTSLTTSSSPPQSTASSSLPLLILPAAYQRERELHSITNKDGTLSPTSLTTFLKQDLDVSRLNSIHKHLWVAGLPQLPRPLHAQLVIGRKVTATEQADMHLVWTGTTLYLKPLPDYLLNHTIWTKYLDPATTDPQLHASALGFLYSYITLILSPSDFHLAQTHHLISSHLTYETWTRFASQVLPSIDLDTLVTLNPRYIYAELRLGRLNTIYRLKTLSTILRRHFVPKPSSSNPPENPNHFTTPHLLRGYKFGYYEYATFFTRNFAWVATVVIYMSVVLSAMQVGLGTTYLQENVAFNKASYGFTVLAIIAPLVIVGVMLFIAVVLIILNLVYTLGRRKKASDRFGSDVVRCHDSHGDQRNGPGSSGDGSGSSNSTGKGRERLKIMSGRSKTLSGYDRA